MVKQIFYPKYAFFVALYAILFTIIGSSFAKILDIYLPKFSKNKKKYKILFEVSIQTAINCILFYAMREYIHALFTSFNYEIYGNPAKFASLIISPTVFLIQVNFMRKVAYLWNVEYY